MFFIRASRTISIRNSKSLKLLPLLPDPRPPAKPHHLPRLLPPLLVAKVNQSTCSKPLRKQEMVDVLVLALVLELELLVLELALVLAQERVLAQEVVKHSQISISCGTTATFSSCASLFNSNLKCSSPSSSRSLLATRRLHNSLVKMKNNSCNF